MMMTTIKRENGITVIELLVSLVIFAIVTAGVYRLFVAQSKAYTVQDRVVENQQSIRSAMEILLRDLRMAGFDNDSLNSKILIVNPVIATGDSDMTVNYEFDDTTQHSVRYWRDGSTLKRELSVFNDLGINLGVTTDTLLDNVDGLQFNYGIDTNEDKALDSWAGPGAVNIVAVRVRLTARPQPPAPEDQLMVSPRTLETTVTLRNLCLR